MASRNIRVALMIAVAFVVTLHVVNQRNTEKYLNFRRERFEGHEDEGKNLKTVKLTLLISMT